MFQPFVSAADLLGAAESEPGAAPGLAPKSQVLEDPYDGNLLLSMSPEVLIFPASLGASVIMTMVPNPTVRMGTLILACCAIAFYFWFYRSPAVKISAWGPDIGLLDAVSPAEGTILRIDAVPAALVTRDYGPLVSWRGAQLAAGGLTPESAIRIVIGMTPLDMHVQCAPMNCSVRGATYRRGQFQPIVSRAFSGLFGLNLTEPSTADLSHKSDDNERLVMELQSAAMPVGASVVRFNFFLVQIAGLLARRIVTFPCAEVGAELERGQKYGMIKFGSRVDLILPAQWRPVVSVGQKVNMGETILARYWS